MTYDRTRSHHIHISLYNRSQGIFNWANQFCSWLYLCLNSRTTRMNTCLLNDFYFNLIFFLKLRQLLIKTKWSFSKDKDSINWFSINEVSHELKLTHYNCECFINYCQRTCWHQLYIIVVFSKEDTLEC